jgi:1-acyl-sn-glycerol-3-phosphate acyltransferase
VWYSFWKGIFTLLFWYLFRLRVEGREHEPKHGPFLAICNHVSAADPPIAGVALRARCRYMTKHEMFRTRVLAWLFRSIGMYPVRRGQPDRQAIRETLEALARGEVVMMFPEGTRSPDGRLMAAEPGAAFLALRAGVPVLPMAVVGTLQAMPKGARYPRRLPVVVRIGPPIVVPRQDGRLDRSEVDAWGRRFMAAIAALLPADQQPRPDVAGSWPAGAGGAPATGALPPSAGS